MVKNREKHFLSYDEQIELLKNKKLKIYNEDSAKKCLKRFGYYSLVSGYKDIFKIEKNGNYKSDASFEHMVSLYLFDDYLKNIVLHEIIRIEKNIKSLYSYSFCYLYGDAQDDYLKATNYNYDQYQNGINKLISIIQENLKNADKHPYVKYNLDKYGSVPLWVIIQTLTFGNISKMFMFSRQKLQSQISREFDNIYNHQLISILNVLSKFRNVCAHGERLYNYKTRTSITDLPIHSKIENYNSASKNNLFNALICLKYLSFLDDFNAFTIQLSELIKFLLKNLGEAYTSEVLNAMGFPENWEEVLTSEK